MRSPTAVAYASELGIYAELHVEPCGELRKCPSERENGSVCWYRAHGVQWFDERAQDTFESFDGNGQRIQCCCWSLVLQIWLARSMCEY